MNEDFLHYVWKYQNFTSHQLKTDDGLEIGVIKIGMHNHNAGPDFLNAQVRIGDTTWAGNIEIHIHASDWYKHNHQNDRAYDNVILHVVYTADKPVFDKRGNKIPVLSLQNLIDYQTFRYYKSWVKKASFISCENMVRDVPGIIKTSAVHGAAVNRLEKKSEWCLDILQMTNGDLEETFYRIFCKALGLKVNAMPFEQLAVIAPISLIRKNRNSLEELQALLLGQAGFLTTVASNNEFVLHLCSIYTYQQLKYQLTPMPESAWKLFRLRPQNFPAVRIAQLATILFRHPALAQQVVDSNTPKDYENLFESALDGFWLTHYTLKAESEKSPKNLGKSTVYLLMINAVVPFLFALASYNKNGNFQEKAVRLLEQLPAEKNRIVNKFETLNFSALNAIDSQGLLGLKQDYCEHLKCLTCRIGVHILKNHGQIN